jgi:hypothetical protein
MIELRKNIIGYLESLVHKRFSKEELEAELTKYFKFPVTVGDVTKEDDELFDYNLLFGMDFKYPQAHIYGFVDVYFLKMRDGRMYITEVGYEFE